MPASGPDSKDSPTATDACVAPTRRRYELHAPGFLYLVITVFLAIGSINSQNNLLFLAFGFAIAGFLLSGLISGPPLMKIRAHRFTPKPTAVGDRAEIRYWIENNGKRLSAMGLEVREIAESRRASVALGKGVSGGVLNLAPGQRASATVQMTPAARGEHKLVAFSVTTTFPFGLFRKTLIFEQHDTWTVAPRRVPLQNMPWHRSGRDGATLSSTAARRGQSMEFYALRQYVPGDPTRQIAWLPSARVGELIVREQASSAPPRLWLRIDEPGSEVPPYLIERAAALVAALAHDANRAGFSVGLRGQGLGRLLPTQGSKQVRAIQSKMAALGEGATDPKTSGRAFVDEPSEPGAPSRALRVRIQYQRKGRSRAGGEFSLSADDLRQWLAGDGIPNEFLAPDDQSLTQPNRNWERTRHAARVFFGQAAPS